MEDINRLIQVVPTTVQKAVQRHNFNIFFHYGTNTFTGKEWGDGKADPSIFNPTNQNTDQWIETAKQAGAYGIILTCKHHDGFCLWPTKTTNYNISASMYKKGKGDVVKEVSESCKKYGIKFGIYLSPWDRNHKAYGSEEYNDVYCQQLTELLTSYGDVWCVWLDGACGAAADGKPIQKYDWERYFATIRKLSPKTAISNCGPDIRWVGNEAGIARESEWNVVPKFSCEIQTIEQNSQKTEDGKEMKKRADIVFSDLGSREFLADYQELMWYPAEVDVSIRPGWFYHKGQDSRVRSLKNLTTIYYNSVGGNSLLLLNIPPDKRGLINEKDVQRMKEFGQRIAMNENEQIKIAQIKAPIAEQGCEIENVLQYSYDEQSFDPLGYYTPQSVADNYCIDIQLQEKAKINRIRLVENTAFSQRIENFDIYADVNGKLKKIYKGTIVGFNKICVFKGISTDRLKIVIEKCRSKPYIEHISVFRDNKDRVKKCFFNQIKQFFNQINYKIYLKLNDKKTDL